MLNWPSYDFFDVHTHHINTAPCELAIVNQYPWDFNEAIAHFSVGIHPWFVDPSKLQSHFLLLKEALSKPGCLAIGECGLDKAYGPDLVLQIEVFEAHLMLAKNLNLPLVIHCVGSFEELIALKLKHRIQNTMVIHGFNKSEALALQLIQHGFYLSLGHHFFKRPDCSSTLKKLPADKLFFETDDSKLEISTIYAKASIACDIPLTELRSIIANNARKVFST